MEERIEGEKYKLEEIRDNPEYDNGIREDIRRRMTKLNDNLSVRQESIGLLKGRLISQITSFQETIAKVLDTDTSLTEKIQTLFREQGITIASMLIAIRMAIGVLVEALLPGGSEVEGGGEVSLHLRMRQEREKGSKPNLKPWLDY